MSERNVVLPTCTAILLCERIIVDALSKNSSLIDVFDSFNVTSFPFLVPSFWVHVQLDDGIGEHQVTAEIRDAADETISQGEGTAVVNFRPHERGHRFRVTIRTKPATVNKTGKFIVVVLCDKTEVGRTWFKVVARA